ncbi:MAG: hypothetical protein ACKOUD_06445 [Rhodoluna sp.]
MNFDGFGGLALAVVAGLWLMVFVPSWFKRSQDRENGIARPAVRAKKLKRTDVPARRNSIDNFTSLARDYGETLDQAQQTDPRDWERTALPAPRSNQGTLEVVEFAEVVQIESVREAVVARKLEQSELDEILRRRRSNG